MSHLAAARAARVEQARGLAVEVTDVEQLSRGLRQVTFAGPSLVGQLWSPGQEVRVRVDDEHLRRYTPMAFDAVGGSCVILFNLAVPGPGTQWARHLALGDAVRLMGPSGGMRALHGRRRLYIGDTSAIGTLHALLTHQHATTRACGTDGSRVDGAVEVAAYDVAATRRLLPDLRVLPHEDAPGAAVGAWLRGQLARRPDWRPDACWLIGHANSLRTLRSQLCAAGVPRRHVQLKGYWSDYRTGL